MIRQQGQQGVALVLVLWVLVLLMVIAATITTTQRNETGMTSGMLQERKGRALISAAHYYMIYRLLSPQPLDQAEDEWKPDGVMREWTFEGVSLGIAATPENGRIDLNMAAPEILDKLFMEAGAEQADAEALRDAILDWIDPDDAHRLLGAEDDDYAAAGLPYGAKDGPFDTLEELRQVMGMTHELYRAVKPALTIYSGQRTVNPIFAPPLVLYALPGMDRASADDYIAQRNESLLQGLPAAMPSGITGNFASPAGVQIYRLYAEIHNADGGQVSGEILVSLGGGRAPRGRNNLPGPPYSILEQDHAPLVRPLAPNDYNES